jgi:predicted  nucleic acid-binding Zn-ribbon protein
MGMAFVKHEFHCSGGCGKYFDFVLNMSLNGSYRLHCPNCGHIHYRVVKNGHITEDRFTDSPDSLTIEDLFPMKSSCRDYQKDKAEDLACSADERGLRGFMHRLWKERFSGQMV